MTKEQINRAIAESLGWVPDPKNEGTGLYKYWSKGSKRMVDPQPKNWDTGTPCDIWPTVLIPDYHSSLDACVEFEETLSDEQFEQFYGPWIGKLAKATRRRHIMTATAPQRCEAYLRTIGKWVD